MAQRTRLRWRCRRGMLELDLLLQGFLERGFEALDESGRAAFERLLRLSDQTLFDLFFSATQAKEEALQDVIERIRHAAAP